MYLVWSPQLGATERNVPAAAALVADPRVRHYWDDQMLVGSAFESLVGSPEPAWDTWMVFGPDATWPADSVPHPSWWEHQMSSGPPSLMLEPERWASHAMALHRGGARRR